MKKIFSFLMVATVLLATLVPLAVPVAAEADVVVTNTFDPNAETPTISTAADYVAFFNAVYNQKNAFTGKTITMLEDVTLNDTTTSDWYEQTGVTKLVATSDTWSWFEGTFDGGNHTLKGAIVEGVFRSDVPLGLFPYARETTIKNLTVDGFYICNDNLNVDPTYGKAGTGGLIGHAKQNVTIDNCILKNGMVTCAADNKGAIGSVIGAYDGQAKNQILTISNCTVEESVNVVAGANSTVYVGGMIGYVHENFLSHSTTVDLSASRIQPNGSMDSDITLKPFGAFIAGGELAPRFAWTLKNTSTSYSKVLEMDGATDYTSRWNDEVIATQCYGSEYSDLTVYTIKWVVDGVETTENYYQGAMPSYKGSTDKPMTDTHLYIFKGWSPEITPVSGDVTYTAQYDEHEKTAVTWIVDGLTTIEYYIKGETPNYKGETNKEQDDDFVYIFKGWDKQIVVANEDVTYTAIYESKAKYDVTWVVDGVETKEVYLAGVKPSFKGKIEKAEDEEFTYKFIGWDKEIVPAEGDVVYTAQFEKTAKNPNVDSEPATSNSGCGSTISVGLVTLVMIGTAGVFAVRKKED